MDLHLRTRSDQELVSGALTGDSRATAEIFQRYVGDISSLARHWLKDDEAARDLVQETFASALSAWPQLRDPSRLKHWLSCIAYRLAHRQFRRRKVLRAAGMCSAANEATVEGVIDPDCCVEIRAELSLLSRAASRMSHGLRLAWSLRYVEGLPLDSIAEKCGCSESTVKRRLARAEKMLGAYLEQNRDLLHGAKGPYRHDDQLPPSRRRDAPLTLSPRKHEHESDLAGLFGRAD